MSNTTSRPERRRRGEGEECSVLEIEALQGLGLVTSEFLAGSGFLSSRSVCSSRDQRRSDTYPQASGPD